MKFISALLILLTYTSVSIAQTTIEHPERERTPYIEQVESNNQRAIPTDIVSKLNSVFKNHSFRSEFGLTDKLVLGSVAEVEVYNSSEYIVLDDRGKMVSIISESGAIIDTVGRSGQGPGEYQSPSSIALDGNDLYVSDRYYSLNKYTRKGKNFLQAEDFLINVVPDQLCILGNEIFIRGSANKNEFEGDDKVIHVFDKETLNHKRSIIDSYIAEGFVGKNELSEGVFHCDKSTNSIFVSFNILPHIYSFSVDGDLNWVATLDKFKPLKIVEEVGPNIQPSVTYQPEGNWDRPIQFTDLNNNFVLFQKITTYTDTPGKYPTITTYAINKSNGSFSTINTVPDQWILLAVQESRFVVNGMLINMAPTLNLYNRN